MDTENFNLRMGDGGNVSDLPCKRCKGVARIGLKCVVCGTISHKSCVKIMKHVRIIDDETIVCCETSEQRDDANRAEFDDVPSTPVDLLPGVSLPDSKIIVLEIELKYLRELLRSKDTTIENQTIAIRALSEQVLLLKSSVSPQVVKPDSGARQGGTSQLKNGCPLSWPPLGKNSAGSSDPTSLNSRINNVGQSTSVTAKASGRTVGQHLNSNERVSRVSGGQRKNYNSTKNQVVGQLTDSTTCSLRAAPKLVHFHLTKLHPDTKKEDVLAYTSDKLSDVTVEQLQSKYPDSYSSFKLSVPEDKSDKVLDPTVWPAGAVLNRFFARRKRPEITGR